MSVSSASDSDGVANDAGVRPVLIRYQRIGESPKITIALPAVVTGRGCVQPRKQRFEELFRAAGRPPGLPAKPVVEPAEIAAPACHPVEHGDPFICNLKDDINPSDRFQFLEERLEAVRDGRRIGNDGHQHQNRVQDAVPPRIGDEAVGERVESGFHHRSAAETPEIRQPFPNGNQSVQQGIDQGGRPGFRGREDGVTSGGVEVFPDAGPARPVLGDQEGFAKMPY